MTKQVIAEGPFAELIPDGVRVGDVIYLSGAISIDEQGAPVHEGDFLAQNRQAYAIIEGVLDGFGADLGNVVKETVFVTDVSMAMGREDAPWQDYAAMHGEVFGGGANEVAQSMIEVSSLVLPGLLVEIEVVAHL